MQVLSNEQLRRVAPSIFATAADENRSERYRFVPTIYDKYEHIYVWSCQLLEELPECP